MSRTSVTAYAPATVANFGPGFDILGLALDSPGDTVRAEFVATPGVSLLEISGDGGALPTDPARNTACVAAAEVLRAAEGLGRVVIGQGIGLRLYKGLPLASGLGSSSASAVAAAVAANALLGGPLQRVELLPACVEAEAIVSGRHADNVAPALLGGIVLVTGITPADVFRLPAPEGLHLAVVSPAVEVPTAQARAVLPGSVSLATMVHQTAQVSLLIHALYAGDIPLLARAVGGDQVIEPARAHLMPLLREAQAAASESGALTTIISGAGPTLCALCASAEAARAVAARLEDLYATAGIRALTQATRVSQAGARVLTTD